MYLDLQAPAVKASVELLDSDGMSEECALESEELDSEPKRISASVYPSCAELSPADKWTNCIPLSPKGKRPPLKTFAEIQTLLQQGRKRDAKLLIRENYWPINSSVRAHLWPALCRQHQHGKSMLDGFYWDMVNQVSTDILSPFSRILIVLVYSTGLAFISFLIKKHR